MDSRRASLAGMTPKMNVQTQVLHNTLEITFFIYNFQYEQNDFIDFTYRCVILFITLIDTGE